MKIPTGPTTTRRRILLSMREIEITYYFIEGESISEIAKLLEVSQNTVAFYLTSVNAKLKSSLDDDHATLSSRLKPPLEQENVDPIK